MPRTGRPRSFDKTWAVEQALPLFWARGYEATSLAELKAAMGDISSARFYAAFGSKEGVFRDVLARYLDTHGRVLAPLRAATLPPREAIAQALRQSVRIQTDYPVRAGMRDHLTIMEASGDVLPPYVRKTREYLLAIAEAL